MKHKTIQPIGLTQSSYIFRSILKMKGFVIASALGMAVAAPNVAVPYANTAPSANITLENIQKIDIGMAGGKQAAKRTLHGPFLDFPDPSIIWGDGSWKAFATSTQGKHVPVAVSNDGLTGWTLQSQDALPNTGWAKASSGIWAPDVQKNVSISCWLSRMTCKC